MVSERGMFNVNLNIGPCVRSLTHSHNACKISLALFFYSNMREKFFSILTQIGKKADQPLSSHKRNIADCEIALKKEEKGQIVQNTYVVECWDQVDILLSPPSNS